MAGISPFSSDIIGYLKDRLSELERRLGVLERPSGTNVNSLVAQVQAALANINATVNAAISANSYTKTQIDARVLNPTLSGPGGSGGNVVSTGTATFAAGLNSTDVFGHLLTYGGTYHTTSTHQDGTLGYVPSSRRFKQDEHPAPVDIAAALAIKVVTFRYTEAVEKLGDAARVEWGVIAEDLHELGFPWLVDYDDNGQPFGVKKDQMIFAFIPVIQDHEARLRAIEAQRST